MSAIKETLIFCDGEPTALCPEDGPYSAGDTRNDNAKEQRRKYRLDGWRFIGGKDYCPACAARMFGATKSTGHNTATRK